MMAAKILRRSNVRRVVEPGVFSAGGRLEYLGGDLFSVATDCSVIDIVDACLRYTGPAHITIATWTSSTSSAEHAFRLLADAATLSVRFLVDHTFPSRQAEFCQALVERFGSAALLVAATHAKFAIVRSEHRAVAVVPSTNLNRHEQLETFDILDDPAAVALLEDVCAEATPLDCPRQASFFDDATYGRDLRRVGMSTRAGVIR